MSIQRTSSRLQRIEAKKNTKQAIMFVLLSIGFLLLLFFIGVPLFIKGAIFLGDMRSSGQAIDKSDTIAPIPPRFANTLEATKSAEFILSGFSEPAATVVLYQNKEKYQDTIVSADGKFIFNNITLIKGENDFYAVATDPSGNESQLSQNIAIIYDSEAPELEITNPSDGANYFDEEREIVVAGKTDKEDTHVTVNNNVVAIDPEGNFVKKLYLTEGDNEIEVKAYDDAGNETVKKIKVNYSK